MRTANSVKAKKSFNEPFELNIGRAVASDLLLLEAFEDRGQRLAELQLVLHDPAEARIHFVQLKH